MMDQVTPPTEEICLCCFGSKIVKSGYTFTNKVKACPLCHSGKITGDNLKKVNRNYQELLDEIAEDEGVDEPVHDFNDH